VLLALEKKFAVILSVPEVASFSREVTVLVTSRSPAPAAVKAGLEEACGVPLGTSPCFRASFPGIPQERFGAIIGKGGQGIRDLEHDTGCCVTVPRDSPGPIQAEGSSDALLRLAGMLEERVGARGIWDGRPVAIEGAGPPASFDSSNLLRLPGTGLPGGVIDSFFFPSSSSLDRFLWYLLGARRTLDVAIFNLTDDRIKRAIARCAAAGVAIRVVTDASTLGDRGNDLPQLSAALPVRANSEPARLMHHKFAIVDGTYVITGSFNWTQGAAESNYENVVVMAGAGVVQNFQACFEDVWRNPTCKPVTGAGH
jgi:hypothetical protein